MNSKEFKIKYAELMKMCMYLEDELRRYYALVNEKYKDIDDYMRIWEEKEEDSMGQLINLLNVNDPKYLISEDFINNLIKAKGIRNYYAHEVFLNSKIIKKDVVLPEFEKKINNDYIFLNSMYDEVCEKYEIKLNQRYKK